MKTTSRWVCGGLIYGVTILVIVKVCSTQSHVANPVEKIGLGPTETIYVGAVVCDQDQFKKLLGGDYVTLVFLGDASKGAFEMREKPQNKKSVVWRIKSLAKLHGLRTIP